MLFPSAGRALLYTIDGGSDRLSTADLSKATLKTVVRNMVDDETPRHHQLNRNRLLSGAGFRSDHPNVGNAFN